MRAWVGAGRPHSFAVKQNEERDDAAIWQWASGIIRMRRMFISNGTCVVNRTGIECLLFSRSDVHAPFPSLLDAFDDPEPTCPTLQLRTTFNTHFANMCLFLGRKDSSSVVLSLSVLSLCKAFHLIEAEKVFCFTMS